MRIFRVLFSLFLAGSATAFSATLSARNKIRACSVLSAVEDEATASEPTDALALVDEALRSNSAAASNLVSSLSMLREKGQLYEAEEILNSILTEIDGPLEAKSSPLPWWCKTRLLTRFSRRSRRASLKRLLDYSTPIADDEEQGDVEALRRRRRRSLFVVLRTLANPDDVPKSRRRGRRPDVVALEHIARKEAKASTIADDLQSRVPTGLETPDYAVVAKRDGGYEIRRYEPFSVCSVSMMRPENSETDAKLSNPQLPGARAFGALAGYLFGKNQASTAMKMTTPVFSTDGSDKSMSFVLPSDYWKEDGVKAAPQPLEGSGLVLSRDLGGERATLMFGGIAGKKEAEKRKAQLLKALERDGEWKAAPDAPVTLAQYNDPFTPPWKRRNEVAVRVVLK